MTAPSARRQQLLEAGCLVETDDAGIKRIVRAPAKPKQKSKG